MTSIWMAAEDPISASQFAVGSSADYMNLFNSAGAWQQVSSNLSVFKIYAAFLANASDAQLGSVISWANQNHVQLALETGVLPVTTPDQPGWGVEGYDGAVVSQVQRLANLGGTLSYLTMDEPFYFGQQWSGTNAAHSSTQVLAEQAAGTISQLKTIFPNLQVGDVEPIPYTQNLQDWFTAFQQATGTKLAYVDADIDWNTSYQQPLAQLATELRQDGITYGVIYNGTAADSSNLSWTSDAIAHFVQVESDPTTTPDQAVFQTWNPYPTQLLDESTPGTLTNVMLQYLQFKGVVSPSAATTSSSGSSSGTSSDTVSVGTSSPALSFSNGIAIPDPDGKVSEAARLYQAAFNRAPDQNGLAYWTNQLEGGASPVDVAQGFITSQEFAQDYSGLNDQAFVVQLYENVLHRAPDASGLQYWNNQLATGNTRAGVLLGFSDSTENKLDTASSMHDGYVFLPKS